MLIHVAAHQQLTKPVRIVFRSLTSTLPDAVHGRVLVVMEAGSQMTLIEEFDSVGDPLSRLHNQVTEICLGANARLTHLRLEAGTHSPLLINRLQVDQSRDSQYEHHSLTLGNTFKRNELCIRLKESAATTRLSGIWLGKARHHLEHQINIEHLAPHCSSATAYKGWLDEESRAVFNGRIYIHKGAAKTQAHLSNQNLLLSNTAEVDTKPELEIYNDDVQCSHGATIGRLDENAVFYFRSRGISQAVAEAMLGFGFINEMILQIPVPAVQAEATRQVTNFLHDIDALRNLWAN
jgi:Fe-S cluster assembly protein SufD